MRKYGKGKGKRTNRKGSNKPSKSFVAKVQKIISKDVETKCAIYSSPIILLNQSLNNTADCLQLLPDITNGFAASQKLGNELRMQSLYFRGVMTFALSQTSPSNTRIGVRLSIVRAKRFNDYLQTRTDFATNFTKLLEGQSIGNLGTVAQFNTPINRDYYSVAMDRRYYMSQSITPGGTTPGEADTVNTTKIINFRVPYSKKILRYDENFDSDTPTNYPWVMLVNYCKLDGSAADADGTTYLSLNYTTTMKYEDE